MFRPTGFADLTSKRVGIFGYGVEGRATAARLRGICHLVVVDDAEGVSPGVLVTGHGGHEALLECDVVIKSPGIPRRREDVVDLEEHGIPVCSALNLWLHETERSRVVMVTGTKGKSTTTALVTFFLQCLGEPAQRLGNIGQPPYDPVIDTSSGWLVVEVSSFQCVDIDLAPAMVIVTSLGSDHLDWHGSLAKYRDDKLSLTRAEGAHVTLVPDSPTFHDVRRQLGGEVTFVPADEHGLARALGLLGAHSDNNVAIALAAAATLTRRPPEEVRRIVSERAADFVPLRGRLTLVATEERSAGPVRYVDDGLATSVLPALAALEVFAHEPLVLLAGGYDRGIDYTEFAAALGQRRHPTLLLTMGNAGDRLRALASQFAPDVVQGPLVSMAEAVREGREFLARGGVVLLSPGAPSFDRYRNWQERSADFTRSVLELIR